MRRRNPFWVYQTLHGLRTGQMVLVAFYGVDEYEARSPES